MQETPLFWVFPAKLNFSEYTVGHSKSGIEVDVSVYKGVGGRVVRTSYDITDEAIDITNLEFYWWAAVDYKIGHSSLGLL